MTSLTQTDDGERAEFPRDFTHRNDGKECRGAYRELRRAKTFAYGSTTEQVEKFILELELDDGDEAVSYWLGSNGDKLVSLFRRELEARARLGKSDFEPGETIVIRQSEEMRPSRTTGNPMWDYTVEFEFAAPPPTAADLLGVTAAASTPSHAPEGMDEPTVTRQPTAATGQLSVEEELPF